MNRLAISIACALSSLALPHSAQAATILSQDFKNGLSAKESLSSNISGGSWGLHDGYIGHNANYSSNERSLYIADLGLMAYTGISLSFYLKEYTERYYDYVTWFTGHYDSKGALVFTALGNVDQGYGSGTGTRNFQIADAERDKLFGFRFTSDHAIEYSGVRINALNLSGTAIGPITDVPGAVPEPATWAMMIVGFGLVGFAMRRRKVRSTLSFA